MTLLIQTHNETNMAVMGGASQKPATAQKVHGGTLRTLYDAPQLHAPQIHLTGHSIITPTTAHILNL